MYLKTMFRINHQIILQQHLKPTNFTSKYTSFKINSTVSDTLKQSNENVKDLLDNIHTTFLTIKSAETATNFSFAFIQS